MDQLEVHKLLLLHPRPWRIAPKFHELHIFDGAGKRVATFYGNRLAIEVVVFAVNSLELKA